MGAPAEARSADRDRRRDLLRSLGDDGRGQRVLPDLVGELLEEIGVLLEEVADVLPPLTEAEVAVREPGSALVDDAGVDRHVEHRSEERRVGKECRSRW